MAIEPEIPSPILPIGLSVSGYKSYRHPTKRIPAIYPVNVVIGKNNSGKTSFLEVIEYLVDASGGVQSGRLREGHPQIFCRFIIERRHIENSVDPHVGGGPIHGSHLTACLEYVGRELCVMISSDRATTYFEEGLDFPALYRDRLVAQFPIPLRARLVRVISAERDVTPEASQPTVHVESNGRGLTNAVQSVINDRRRNQSLVEVELLNVVNGVLDNDSQMGRIFVQNQSESPTWEIFFETPTGVPVPLSASGSGLKTILLTAFQLKIGPAVEGMPVNRYVFLLEELENNIHPGLLRRLFSFVRAVAVELGAYVFIATHSNVVLDMFSTDPLAQIIHVTRSGAQSDVEVVTSLIGLHGILNDLDIRASDLLQSNGVIWVEGPSDRIYINRFLEVWSDGVLREGTHYQIVFYGGRLLNSLTASPENESLVNLMRVNRNAFVVMDRDTETIGTAARLVDI